MEGPVATEASADSASTRRWIVGSLVLGALVFAARTLQGFADAPYRIENSVRITPAVALGRGYSLYYGPDSGPIFDFMYGPVPGILYTPASLGSSPTPVMWIGIGINLLLFVAPLVWLQWRMCPRSGPCWSWHTALLGLVCFGLWLNPGLVISLYHHHADPAALGLAACACACLTYRVGSRERLALLSSAIFAVLSVWSKQTTVPLLLALPLYLWLADGPPVARRYVLDLLLVGVGVSALFLLIFDARAMLFNMFVLPARHGFTVETVGELLVKVLQELLLLLRQSRLPAAVVILAVLVGARPLGFRAFVREHSWTMLVMVSSMMLLTALPGMMKAGGYVNSASPLFYFLYSAAAVCLGGAAVRGDLRAARLTRLAAVVLTLYFVTGEVANWQRWRIHGRTADRLLDWRSNPQEKAYRFARAHPGEAYFPDNPLPALLAEGVLYHSTGGLVDRSWAGLEPAEDHYRALLPPRMRLVATQAGLTRPRAETFSKRLPEFDRRVEVEGLEGWTVWERSDGGQP